MSELKADCELLRIYTLRDETNEQRGILIAAHAPDDVVLATLKLAVQMLEKGQGQHIKDVRIKEPGDVTFHTEK